MMTTYRSNVLWLICPPPMKPDSLWFALAWLDAADRGRLSEVQKAAREHPYVWPREKDSKVKLDEALLFAFIIPRSFDYETKKGITYLRPPVWMIVDRYLQPRSIAALRCFAEAYNRELSKRNPRRQPNAYAVWAAHEMKTAEPLTEDNFVFWRTLAEYDILGLVMQDGQEAAEAIATRILDQIEINFND